MTLDLASHAPHRVADEATVVVLGVDAVVDLKVEIIRVVRIVDHRRPIVAEGTNDAGRTVPVPGIREIQW